MAATLYKQRLTEKRDIYHESSDSDMDECLLEQDQYTQKNAPARHGILFSYLGCALLILNVLWSTFLVFYSSGESGNALAPNLIISPARSAVAYEVVSTNSTLYDANPFRGRPNPEVTAMWHNSYSQWEHIVISEEELKAMGRQSLPLADGSGYLAVLEVFHQLHCLNMIREYIYSDYYWSAETTQRAWEHADHCIDTIRLALMCHGDIAVVTFGWEDGEVLPSPDFNIQHECRNWDNLLEWAKPRKADMSQVVRPQ